MVGSAESVRTESAVPTAKLGVCNIKIVSANPESAVPTAKLDVCDIKIVTAYPDGVIKIEKRPTIDNNRRAYFF